MLRWLTNGWGSFTAAEASAVEHMATCHQALVLDGALADLRTDAGYAACVAYLDSIDKACNALGLEASDRAYRTNFSLNYKALFPDDQRYLRVDVLEASVDQHSEIWVNGELFQLSEEARTHAQFLQSAWVELSAVLRRCTDASAVLSSKPERSELAAALATLDFAWTQFESQYITELIRIEERARQQVVDAVNFDRRLRALGSRADPRKLPPGSPAFVAQHLEAERGLVRCIAHLNSVANFKRKGRDDLGLEILHSAMTVMRRVSGPSDILQGDAREIARILAYDVIASFEALRAYLNEVSTCLERVDPHLCNNLGLVARLADWEESWEVGAKYVLQTPMLEGVCDLIAHVKALKAVTPVLVQMCEDCDVELFLVLPRLVVLCFLADPQNRRQELMKALVPHHFIPNHFVREVTGQQRSKMDLDFETLLNQFRITMQVLASSPCTAYSPSGPQLAAWEIMMRRAIFGASEAGPLYQSCPPPAKATVEDLFRTIEKHSLELQRRCPEDWNQFSSVFVQCLIGGKQREPPKKFQV